ncbi:helix-turn-helix domain-containing protein [bacterium]|nr:helix-turn-helix domain-containing protein [bacterium]
MKFLHFKPSPFLKNYVREYWILEDPSPETQSFQRLIPFGAFEWIFTLGAPTLEQFPGQSVQQQAPIFLTGQFLTPVFLKHTGPFHVVGVSFHPWAGTLITGDSAKFFTNASVDWSLINPKDSAELHERIISTGAKGAIRILENYLHMRLSSHRSDPVVMSLAQLILQNPVDFAFSQWTHRFGLSRRRVEQKFIDSVGITAGTLSKKSRLHHTIKMISRFPEKTLTEIALESGYYDQAHCIRDFKMFTGLTPGQYVKENYPLRKPIEELVGA